ncbi:Uncharacterised protein [Klebsiella pneumoniae subsp. rhinoscleromatis]|nr:Uncharacterised protein [Klebsiella pneumoniae subsp. rhinoscleromatis]
MKKVIVALALSAVAFGASAAQLITKEEVKHFKLTKVGPISVGRPVANSLRLPICTISSPSWPMRKAESTT